MFQDDAEHVDGYEPQEGDVLVYLPGLGWSFIPVTEAIALGLIQEGE